MNGRIIICGYPGIGKTTLSKKYKSHIHYYDASKINRKKDGWEKKYIKKALKNKKHKILFLSDAVTIRNNLNELGVPFFYVLPDKKAYNMWNKTLVELIVNSKSKKDAQRLTRHLFNHIKYFDIIHKDLDSSHKKKKDLRPSETVVTFLNHSEFIEYVSRSLNLAK